MAPAPEHVVCILQNRLVHYRVEVFRQLRDVLSLDGIQLRVIHGQPSRTDETKNDVGFLPWATPVHNLYFPCWGVEVIWQPAFKHVHGSDLVILTQENRILSNYVFIFNRMMGKTRPRIAFWGHGANFQSTRPTGLRERWKKTNVNRVDWWFAYTELTQQLVEKCGFPSGNITCLNNAIDTTRIRSEYDSIHESEILREKSRLNIGDSNNVGIFCGSLYREKELGFLIQATKIVREAIPDFHLIVIGAGPDRQTIVDSVASCPWIHYLGAITGRERLVYFRMSRLMLNPGLLGLHILDSFALGVPVVSTTTALHSPEIAYLQNGKNGLLVEKDADVYAAAAVKMFRDEHAYQGMRRTARADADKYTVENMVSNFARGIREALSS